jgi:excisionase family DNA binding protein
MTTQSVDSGVGGAHSEVHDASLTPSQAGEYLRTGERFVRRLIAERPIAYVKLGKYVRLKQSVLDAFAEAGECPSSSKSASPPGARRVPDQAPCPSTD